MRFHPLRALLAIAAFWVISATGAHAVTVKCPSKLTSTAVSSEPGKAASVTATTLSCSFPVYYTAIAQEIAPGVCAPTTDMLNFAFGSGGAGWAIQGNPVDLHSHAFVAANLPGPHGTIPGIHYCYFGTPIVEGPIIPAFVMIATSPVPPGDQCVVSGANTFSCTAQFPPPVCPATVASSKIPTGPSFPAPPFSPIPAGAGPWYYQWESGIGQSSGPMTLFEPGNTPLSTIESAINQYQTMMAFSNDTWASPNVLTQLPAGYVGCQYKGKTFAYPFSGTTYQLTPIIAIACKGTACSF